MASLSSSNPRLKPKKPLDVWSTREKLCLASAVFKIGDQNWVSVSRAIKPYAEPNRHPEWFHQKPGTTSSMNDARQTLDQVVWNRLRTNCLLQYYDMMEQLEQPKRKRGGDKAETDTPSLQIMRRMTIERSEQLKKEIMEMQQSFKQLKSEVESVKAGLWDDRIKDVWEEIKEEQQASEEQIKVEVKVEGDDDESKSAVTESSDVTTPVGDLDDNTQDSIGNISVLTDEEASQSTSTGFLTSTPVVSAASSAEIKMSTASHLLSSLLKSEVKTATGLQQLKQEQEQVQQQHAQGGHPSLLRQKSLLKTPVTQDDPLTAPPSSSAPTLSRLLSTAKGQAQTTNSMKSTTVTSSSEMSLCTSTGATAGSGLAVEDLVTEIAGEDLVLDEFRDVPSVSLSQDTTDSQKELDDGSLLSVVEEVEEEVVDRGEEADIKVADGDMEEEDQSRNTLKDLDVEGVDIVKEEIDKDSQDEDEDLPHKRASESIASEAELSFKDEPLSPTSSISSRISETGSKRGSRSRGRPKGVRSARVSTRKSATTEDERKDDGESSRHSDVELSEDDARESDDLLGSHLASVNVSSVLSESFPNSPASLSICSDTEEEKSFKQWKKSIMLVWRAAATHKYANVFLHPVTDEIAPGYRSVVLRPMDLSTIKKNVENGTIRTTVDFQHDMMLMFTNAIMYNSSDHNVYKMAMEMYDDVMQHIEQYVNTQMMMQSTDSKNLRQSRRPDASDKEDDVKKRRLSIDQSDGGTSSSGGGKTKKRKTRLDETLP